MFLLLFWPGVLGWQAVFGCCRGPKGLSRHNRFRLMRFSIVMALPGATCGSFTSAWRPIGYILGEMRLPR